MDFNLIDKSREQYLSAYQDFMNKNPRLIKEAKELFAHYAKNIECAALLQKKRT